MNKQQLKIFAYGICDKIDEMQAELTKDACTEEASAHRNAIRRVLDDAHSYIKNIADEIY